MKEAARLTFWDHCLGGKSPVLCIAVGEIIMENDLFVLLRHWSCEAEENDEFCTILKSTIVARAVAKFE